MAITILHSGSPSAPAMYGAVGRLIAVLDFCLVTGLGWAKTFTGTNLATYRAPTGNRRQLRVNDANAQNSVLRGYEAMTAVSTGTGLFPTTTQVALASGLYLFKSFTADTVPRYWYFISNGVFFHLFVWPQSPAATPAVFDASAPYFCHFGFGDFPSFISGDVYNTLLIAPEVASSYIGNGLPLPQLQGATGQSPGKFIPRIAAGTGTAQSVGTHCDGTYIGSSLTASSLAYPTPNGGGILMARNIIHEAPGGVAKGPRGIMPGIWGMAHEQGVINHGDTWTGIGALAGKSFMYLGGYGWGGVIIETSNTWDAA